MASLYIHIPFCAQKCVYCDFYSLPVPEPGNHTDGIVGRFLSALEKEIEYRSTDPRHFVEYQTLFFGGGTPSFLQPEQLISILDSVRSRFTLSPGAEITLEANPGTVNAAALMKLRSGGFNRISFGVQSFDDRDLRFLTRIHTAAEAKQSIQDAFRCGFENVGLDLIFSLPGQSIEGWKANLEQAVDLQPTHISCYSLILEPGTPLFAMVQSQQVVMPGTSEDADHYALTMEYLAQHGYQQYEVSNFAREGFKCLHNLNYWNYTPYLGFGPSAHSFWENHRWWNVSDLSEYCARLDERTFPLSGEEVLSDDQRMEEKLFLGLRSEGAARSLLQEASKGKRADRRGKIEELVLNEYAQWEGEKLRLTPKGYLLCDEICASIC